MRIILLVFLFLFVQSSWAQESFGSKWYGSWKGTLYIAGSSGKQLQTGMKIDISPLTDTSWNFITTYDKINDSGKDVRPYELKLVNAKRQEYVTDEKDGILLKERLLNNKLISWFEVQGTILLITYELIGNEIHFEAITTQKGKEEKSGKGTEEVPFVYSYPVLGYQHAVLQKQ